MMSEDALGMRISRGSSLGRVGLSRMKLGWVGVKIGVKAEVKLAAFQYKGIACRTVGRRRRLGCAKMRRRGMSWRQCTGATRRPSRPAASTNALRRPDLRCGRVDDGLQRRPEELQECLSDFSRRT